jgi:hypothetical protein
MEIRRAAKAGRGPALFDLLPRDQSELREAPESTAVHGRDEVAAPAAVPEAAATSADPVAEAADVIESGRDGKRIVELDGDRVRLSFTSITGAASLFVVLGLLGGAFWLGQNSGWKKGVRRGFQEGQAAYGAAALDDIAAARRQPPATHLIGSLLEDPSAAQSGVSATVPGGGALRAGSAGSPWVRDHTYVVVQEFSAGRESHARAAQAFVAQKGIGTEIVVFPSGAIQLITTQGFNRSDPTQRQLSDQHLRRLHEIGSEYWTAGGGYKLEGYFKTLKNDSW